jgi:uridine kinase
MENISMKSNLKYLKILHEIDKLMVLNHKVFVAIDGNSGAGKSTLANMFHKYYDCNIFHMDDFFLRPELKTRERLKEVGGNVDYKRFKEEVLDNLTKDIQFKYQVYNCKIQSLDSFSVVKPKKLNIIEGSYSMHPTLINYYDYKIFLSIDSESQIKRILERNGEFMLKRFIDEWIPKENEYFTKFSIMDLADVVID